VSPVRRAIEFLVTRLLRSRLGIALALAVVIAGLVGAARLVSGPGGSDPGLAAAPVSPITTVDPHVGDDGAIATQPPGTPSLSPGAARPEAVARSFTTAYLAHRDTAAEQWLAALRPFSTDGLTAKLTGVDPASVPIDRRTGDPTMIVRSAELVEVTVPVDAGRLLLQLVLVDGRWLVDVLDWERG
jgi:hypothetical protein